MNKKLTWIMAGIAFIIFVVFSNNYLIKQNLKGKPLIVGAKQTAQIKTLLSGKRVGLIVNQASRAGDVHLIDMLQSEGIDIQRLFAVEHGVRGSADAGMSIDNSVDRASGLPIISIYGKSKTPQKQDIHDLDMLVFDLQDVGTRFYTYLSSLHYVMESCARHGVPLAVLDRPNPNIAYVDGPLLEPAFQSFVGMHPIPVLHGMTLGELAKMINGQGWLKNGKRCELTIIPVENYTRAMPYNLPIKPSPNLPNSQAIALYPSLALFEATNISVGRGTNFPFQVLGGADEKYGDFTFTPRPITGAALHPKLGGHMLHGKDLRTADVKGLHIEIFIDWHKNANEYGLPFLTRPGWLDKLMGTDNFRRQVQASQSALAIRKSWQKDLDDFKRARAPYLIYPEK